jgi:hypothetical protein
LLCIPYITLLHSGIHACMHWYSCCKLVGLGYRAKDDLLMGPGWITLVSG